MVSSKSPMNLKLRQIQNVLLSLYPVTVYAYNIKFHYYILLVCTYQIVTNVSSVLAVIQKTPYLNSYYLKRAVVDK